MNTIKALCRNTTLFYLLLFPSLLLTNTITHAADSASSAIIVDQFGYLPELEKIAIIRDPKVGLDSADSYTPGATLSLVNIVTGQTVFSAAPVLFNAGITHAQSGDKVWHFDFSSITKSGKYEVLDSATGERSATFRISPNVYKTVLKHAVRTFFYQRAGFAKREPYADARWAIPGSHRKPDQDADAKRFDRPSDQSLSRKLVGGWYDAGDYNKYTNWHSRYIIELLHAWRDYPDVWGDNFNIPKSGNGLPDILDETRFGVLWLRRMQEADGSVLSY